MSDEKKPEGRAGEDIADEIHGLVAKRLRNMLADESQELSPAFISSAIKWLKDNGVDRPGRANLDEDSLDAQLPEMDDVIRFPGQS